MAVHGWTHRLAAWLVVCGCGDDGVLAEPTNESNTGSSTSRGSESGTASESSGGLGSGSSGAATHETSTADGDDGPQLDVGKIPDFGGGEQPLEPIPTTCMSAASGYSSVGCEFFAVDLDQLADELQFAVVISNVQLEADAEVVVERRSGGTWIPVAGPVEVGPLQQHVFELPDLHQHLSGVLQGGAYRIRSDTPVAAYQFNPLAVGGGSSDASLLLPVTSWDHINHAVGWDVPFQDDSHSAYVTIAAAFDGTVVTVTPTAPPDAGVGVSSGPVEMPFDVELDAGDIVVVSYRYAFVSVTGTRIESDPVHPVAVFSGAECSEVLTYACDHLEEQLSGVRQWGQDFVAARVPPRDVANPESSAWQIYASEDGTTVELTAAADVTGLPDEPVELDAGELLELEVGGSAAQPGDFFVHADRPIALVNYMTGASAVEPAVGLPRGDPLMVQAPPVEQFLPRYVVLVPTSWEVDMITLTRIAPAEIMIDGIAVDDDVFVDVGDYQVARVPAADGMHVLESEVGFGVIVTGWSFVDSYGYAGGYGTSIINPTPEG